MTTTLAPPKVLFRVSRELQMSSRILPGLKLMRVELRHMLTACGATAMFLASPCRVPQGLSLTPLESLLSAIPL